MAPRRRRTARGASSSELHRRWLDLVDTDGPFLAVPPLKRVWPAGMPNLRSTHPDRIAVLTDARTTFEAAWEAYDRHPGTDEALEAYRTAQHIWVETVLRDIIGWRESLQWGNITAQPATSPNRVVTIEAQAALIGSEGPAALVLLVDPTDSLRQVSTDRWAATPIDRLDALLRVNGVEMGVVTDGRWWALVCSADGRTTASGVFDALTWTEEPRTRDAFFTLLGRQHLIGGDPAERLPQLFAESVAAAEEITEALGAQVRRAVELLVQAFSESAAEAKRRGQPDPLPARVEEIYQAAVTIMMRVVFLLFAEERGLLPTGALFESGYGLSGELHRLEAIVVSEGEEMLDATSQTWHRLLATSHALDTGASFEDVRMPAYGGSLFDPDRFPFLTATTERGGLVLTVSDRVMLHVLRSVQIATVGGEARRISFRDLDVEQVGYVYEGLLGYSCTVVSEVHLGLIGTEGAEPEIPLSVLEDLAAAHPDSESLAAALREWVKADQPSASPKTVAAIAKALAEEPDASAVSALNQVVGGDTELRERIEPWLGLIRRDLRGVPLVVLEGGLMVIETPSRRNAGAHYTPRSLAEEVVLHALEPCCYDPGPHQSAGHATWKLRSSDDLLGLKVVDLACGSGAFLVAAARYLADRLVEAWCAEDPANQHRADLRIRAIRQVVANCLYGADINDMAVEMCKLSMWLVSLDPELPFSFVDDKIFVGNSLLGLTRLDQLRRLHIDPARVPPDRPKLFDVDLDATIDKAISLRARLVTEVDDDDPARSASAKRRQLAELRAITADLRHIADGVIAAGLALGGAPGAALDDAYDNLRLAVGQAHPPSGSDPPRTAWLDGLIERGLTPTVRTDYERWVPLHWVLEAPDVVVDRGGFDAVIGNPPFLGGKKISGAVGSNVREWLVNILGGGVRGNADLVAYSFLRAAELLHSRGSFGLIATNTIAQGDTREVGLDAMVESGFTITRATRSQPWPASSANLEFAAVWATRAEVPDDVPRVADGEEVRRISTLLEPAGRVDGLPYRLQENAGIAFIGCYVLGMGFVIEPDEAQAWIDADPRNVEVLFPYLNGEDLNSRPDSSASRWVIDFGEMPERDASTFGAPWERLLATVRLERSAKDASKYPRAVEEWWKFWNPRPAMRAAIADLSEVLVIARVSKTVMPLRVPNRAIPSEACVVFATDSFPLQAVLSSGLHQLWAITHGSTLETRVRYTPSDVFETFPRPPETDWLDRIGRTLDEERREMMLRRQLGLTALYNLVNDPGVQGDADVDRLRAIHVELDYAVLDAYGWSDLSLDHGFHTYRKMRRWTVSPAARVELLDRLLEENHRRHAAEQASGTTRSSKPSRKPSAHEPVGLFDDDDQP